jgi:hypothetical protein
MTCVTPIFKGTAKIRLAAFAVATTWLAFAGAARADDIKVYRIAKDNAPAATPNAAAPMSTDAPLPAGHPDVSSMPSSSMPMLPGMGAPAGAKITYTTPAGWTEQPANQMRVASFKISGTGDKKAEVSVVPLPGTAGGDEANVNRWRGQVGLSPASPDELQKSAQTVDIGGQSGALYDLASESDDVISPVRILAGILHRDDMVWFFKITGDNQLVEAQKPALLEFLKSVKFAEAGAAPSAAASSELPPSHPPIGMGAPATGPVSHEGQPNWQVPAGWQETSGGQFLVAKFLLTSDTAVNVSQSSGTGGGIPGNVNRWRGQLGLPPQAEEDVTKSLVALDTAAGKAWQVDLSGTNARTGQPARLLAVIVPQGDQTWFYKLMGDAAVVESHKAEFLQFVQGVKY